MADARFDQVILSQEFGDRLGLGGRLDDDEEFLRTAAHSLNRISLEISFRKRFSVFPEDQKLFWKLTPTTIKR